MKILFAIIPLTFLLTSISYAQVKIGLPSGNPQFSSVLDLSNLGDPTKGLILPRITNTSSVATPINGMLVYDLSSNCTKVYDNGGWSSCLSTPASAATVNCAGSTLNGNYYQGTALTASNTVTILVNNSSSASLIITTSTTDIYLSGTAAAGMSVMSVTPATLNLPANGSSIITYTLSGTPTTLGSFTATWTKLGLTCVKTGNVCAYISPITVTSSTAPLILPIPTEAGNSIYFTAAGGTPNTGIAWVITSIPSTGVFSSPATGTGNTAQVILVAGVYNSSVTVTYTITNGCNAVTGTKTVNLGDQLRIALLAGGCTSCTAYDAAAANTWVNITAAEYAQIDNYMPVNIGACDDALMNTPTANSQTAGYTWLSFGPDALLLPANNYVVAFSTINATGAASANGYIKYSTSINSGFSMGGPTLNVGATAAGAKIYFLMKKPSAVINATADSYVAFYSGAMQAASIATGNINYDSQDTDTLPSTYGMTIQYQIKSTASKRW